MDQKQSSPRHFKLHNRSVLLQFYARFKKEDCILQIKLLSWTT